MKVDKLFVSGLLIVLGVQSLQAYDFDKNNILQFQIKKNSEIVASEYVLFSTEMARNSGTTEGLLQYKCTKSGDKTIATIGTEMYGVDNYRELKCVTTKSGDADCVMKIFNAKSKNAEAIKEYESKSCKSVSPEVITNEYKFTLKKNSTDNLKLTDGFSFSYSFQEEK